MNKKDTVLIVYPMGAYGTFLEWCLNYFSGRLLEDDLPFKSNGSSHKFKGFTLDFPGSITSEDYFLSSLTSDTARSHGFLNNYPKGAGRVKDYINLYKEYVRFLINIKVDQNYDLLVFHNTLGKTDTENVIEKLEILAKIDDADDIWIKREKLSFVIRFRHDHWEYFADSDKQITITVSDLIINLKATLQLIFNKIGFSFDYGRLDRIDSITEQWLSLQKYKHIDQLCDDIINYTITGNKFDWSKEKLTIYDEAYIQMRLRTLHNIELRCYNVNEFPTNSTDLRKILIHV